MKYLKTGLVALLLQFAIRQVCGQAIQTGDITGQIIDRTTKQAVPAATILITELKKGVVTDSAGKFSISQIPVGVYTLMVSSSGYQEKQITDVNVIRSKSNYLEIEIDESVHTLEEVAVRTYKYENNPRTPVSVYGFSREEISRNPGAQGDIFRAIGMLPGVAANGAEYSAIAVRGQGTRDNLYLVDDIPVSQVSHLEENGSGFNDPNGGRFSIFAPRVIDNAQFIGGGFGAEYGRKSSSVLNLGIKTGNPTDPFIDGQLDLLGFTVNYDGPSYVLKNTSLFVSARYQNFDPLVNLINRKDGGHPSYGDYIFKSVTELNKKNRLSAVAIFSPEIYTRDIENVKADTGLNYTLILDAKNTKDILGLSLRTLTGSRSYWKNILYFTRTKLNYSYGDSYPVVDKDGNLINKENIPYREDLQRIIYSEAELGYRSVFSASFKNNAKLTAGIDVARVALKNYRRLNAPDTLYSFGKNDLRPDPTQYYSVVEPQYYNADFDDANFNASAYIDYSTVLFKKLTVNAGGRYDYFGFSDEHTFSPRLSGSFLFNATNTINFATGIYYQDPIYSEIADQPATKKLKEQRTMQFIVGYRRYFSPNLKLTIEGWYKDLDKLIVRPVSGISEQINDGTGRAGGFDISVTRRLAKNFHGQLGYSLMKSKRNDHDGWGEYDFDFSQTHQANFLLAYNPNEHWILSTKFRYATGKPTSSYIIHYNVLNNPDYIRHSQELIGKNDLRMADFIVVDVRVDYRFKPRGFVPILFADIANINNRLNENRRIWNAIHGRTFVDGLAIFPTFGLKFEY